MSLFWIFAAALLLLGMWMLAGSLLRQPAQAVAAGSASQSNLAVIKSQLQQLDQDLAGGAIDEAQHRLSRAEIERRLLDEEGVASAPARHGATGVTLALVLTAVPVLVLALYGALGSPQAVSPAVRAAAAPHGDPTQQDVEALVAKLAARMESQPPGQIADTEGWVMLGRSYAAMQRYPEAQRAFTRALQLMPDEAQILADQADVTGMLQGGNLQGEPQRLIDRALQNNPTHLKALALAGTAAFERRDFAGAISYWGRARAVAPPEGEFAQGLDRSIAEARAAAGTPAPTAPAAMAQAAPAVPAAPAAPAQAAAPSATAQGPGSGATGPGPASISGRVSLAPGLATRVAPGDTLFVFARAAEGPRMPLAILKHSAGDLPLRFTLDDSMAMTPQFRLSAFANVVVGARISKSGNATPQSGDLEVLSAPLNGRSSGVELVIDSVRP